MLARIFAWLLGWAGRRRLKDGYCPACYSSPPRARCVVCDGAHSYGDALTPEVRRLWAVRWSRVWGVVE